MTWQQELEALLKSVEQNPSVKAGVNNLLTGIANIAGKIKDDAGAVQDFANGLIANATKAADAVVANAK